MNKLFEMDEVPVRETKSNEWFTPHMYIEAAKAVMGDIDLDPASCLQANQVVRAGKIYTKEQNGLMYPWHGRVFLNPPYGRLDATSTSSPKSWQKCFVEKLLQEYSAGRVEQAITLMLGNACFMRWFQPLWGHTLCFHAGQISFWRPDGSKTEFGFGTIFAYLGPNDAKFTEVFSRFGRIVKAVDEPKQSVQQPTLFDLEAS